jgi:hypothetical protein
MTTTNPPVRLGELSTQWKDAAIAALVSQIDECHERIAALEAERDRLMEENLR